MLYAFAASTGFRARECAAVRRSDIDEGFRFVNLSGMFTKNRKKAMIPIPTALGQALVVYAAKLSGDEFLFPGGWEKQGEEWVNAGWIKDHRASDFLRFDAAGTGIVIGRKGKAANGGKVLDFHSFRHTYISNLERAGVSDGMKEKLSRATAGVLERYTHHDLDRFSEASDRMEVPNVLMFAKSK
jgi:integrase